MKKIKKDDIIIIGLVILILLTLNLLYDLGASYNELLGLYKEFCEIQPKPKFNFILK